MPRNRNRKVKAMYCLNRLGASCLPLESAPITHHQSTASSNQHRHKRVQFSQRQISAARAAHFCWAAGSDHSCSRTRQVLKRHPAHRPPGARVCAAVIAATWSWTSGSNRWAEVTPGKHQSHRRCRRRRRHCCWTGHPRLLHRTSASKTTSP